MRIQKIKLSDLVVNRANDRHGELVDEHAAVQWLLTHRTAHMRNLAKDIVQFGGIFEPPLVSRNSDKYVVYDGNRRTATLKLLNDPQSAPSRDWAKFFNDLRSDWSGPFPIEIDCQVEDDRERLDEILYRRHTGQKGGVGQSQWDAEAKSNFEKRTGKNDRINVAEEIESLLTAAGRLAENEKIPRANMKRLLSAEQFRNRVGISIERNKLKFTHEQSRVLEALEHISRDLISKKITLEDIWDNNAKRRYLDDLSHSGILPTANDALPEAVPQTQKAISKTKETNPRVSVSTSPERRRTLIRNIDFDLIQTHHNRRPYDIFVELQHKLKFDEHDNAIAVLFRVLVELSIELYIREQKVDGVVKDEKLSKKYRKVLSHMLQTDMIDKKYHDSIKKFEYSDPILSANTLNAYVHNPDFFPSDHHLKNMWDTLERFVVLCLKS